MPENAAVNEGADSGRAIISFKLLQLSNVVFEIEVTVAGIVKESNTTQNLKQLVFRATNLEGKMTDFRAEQRSNTFALIVVFDFEGKNVTLRNDPQSANALAATLETVDGIMILLIEHVEKAIEEILVTVYEYMPFSTVSGISMLPDNPP